MSEFDLINHYFTWQTSSSNGVVNSVGDDAAVLTLPENTQLVTSIDTLISGVHFPVNTSPQDIGYKSLAVNLSDLAAMGATPAWFTLALSLPEKDTHWLQGFSTGLKEIATQYHCDLVGGDTTRNPHGSISISIQVMGWLENDTALLRSGAQAGDKIYVTGTLGDAALGLQSILGKETGKKADKLNESSLDQADLAFCEARLNRPTPRVSTGLAIREMASSCIDISDGLLQDLSHILKASGQAAKLDITKIPFSRSLKKIQNSQALDLALSGGDDYELLFSIPANRLAELDKLGLEVSCIGEITQLNQQDAMIIDSAGNTLLNQAMRTGYNHFNDE